MTKNNKLRVKMGALLFAFIMISSMVAAGFAGSTAAQTAGTDISVTVESGDITAGSAQQSVGLITIADDQTAGDNALATRTIITLPDGVTINESASDFLLSTSAGSLTVESSQVQNGGSTLFIEHSGASDDDQSIRIKGTVVDVAPDVSASQGGSDLDINVDYAIGEEDFSGELTADKPQIDTGGTSNIAAGTSSSALQSDITITAGANTDGQISNNSDIVIFANESNGITFDTSVDPTAIDVTQPTNGEVDMSGASLTGAALTIPVTSQFTSGDVLTIDANGDNGDALAVATTTDASDSKLNADIVAEGSTGTISAQRSADTDISIQKPAITFNTGTDADLIPSKSGQTVGSPQFKIESKSSGDLADGSEINISAPVAAGFEFDTRNKFVLTDGTNEELKFNDGAGPYTTDVVDAATGDAAIESGDKLTGAELASAIESAMNASATNENFVVSFNADTNQFTFESAGNDADADTIQFSDAASTLSDVVGFSTDQTITSSSASSESTVNPAGAANMGTAGGLSNTNVVVREVTSDQITIDITGASSDGSDVVDVTDIAFNVSANANATAYQTFTGAYANSIESSTSKGVQAANAPKAYFNTNDNDLSANTANATFFVDNDGVSGATDYTGPGGGGTDQDFVLESTQAGDIADGTFVNVTLPADSGVSFDTRSANAPTVASSLNTTNGDAPLVTEKKLAIQIDNGDSGGTESVAISGVAYNISAGSGGEVVSPTVTSSAEAGTTYTQQTEKVIKVKQATPETIVYDTTPGATVNEKAEYAVKVTNSSLEDTDAAGTDRFGGVDITYNVTNLPESGAEFVISDTTSTDSDGLATVNFTMDTTGDYDVEAYPTGHSDVNATTTISASSGSPTSLDLVHAKNAFTSSTYTSPDNEAQAVLTVKDSGGNNVTSGVSNIEAFLTAGGNAQIKIVEKGSFDGTKVTANGDGSFDVPSDGKLYITYEDSNAETVSLGATERNDDVTAATGTDVSFYDPVTTVDVSTNVSSLSVGEAASVTYTVSNSDGAVEVSGLSLSAGVNNGTVGSVAANSLTTDSSGQATTTFTAAENGTTTITGITKSKQGTTSITVEPTNVTPPSPVVGNNTPTDIDGDGTFEDVNGDDSFDIVDVQAVFDNRDSSAIQDNAAAYDYNGDGEFTIVDVNRLFQDSQA